MNKTKNNLLDQNKDLIGIGIASVSLLMMPLVGMQFSSEVSWDLFDFIVAGTLLFGMGLAYTILSRLTRIKSYRMAIGFVLLIILGLAWAELAVGIFGTPFAGS